MSNHTDTQTVTIEMTAARSDRAEHYGVIFESTTLHTVSGRGVHNPAFNHRIEIWENRRGTDPHGTATEEPHSVLMSARPSVISAHKQEPQQYGPHLTIGHRVTLTLAGFPIGTYEITAGRLSDPMLVKVDA